MAVAANATVVSVAKEFWYGCVSLPGRRRAEINAEEWLITVVDGEMHSKQSQ